MSRDVVSLLVWWLLLGLGPPLLVRRSALRHGERVYARLFAWGAPIVVAAIWTHGVLFDPPNNWLLLDEQGLFAFWFKSHPEYVLRRNAGWVAGLLAVGIVPAVALLVGARAHARAVPGGRAPLAWRLVVLGALVARHAPDHVMDLLVLSRSFPDKTRFLDAEALLAFVAGVALIAAGLRTARRA